MYTISNLFLNRIYPIITLYYTKLNDSRLIPCPKEGKNQSVAVVRVLFTTVWKCLKHGHPLKQTITIKNE